MRIAALMLNDWPYWVGRALLRLFRVSRLKLESASDEPADPFPSMRFVTRRDGAYVVSVLAQCVAGWAVVALIVGCVFWALAR
jgi:hypothetical protein